MAQNLDPLRTSFEQKPPWLAFANTFSLATETTVEELKNCSKHCEKQWFFWKNWCVDKEITDEIENYEPAEFNTLLEHFYAEVKVTMASLDRHLKNEGCTLSIVRDREFSSSKEVCESEAASLGWSW